MDNTNNTNNTNIMDNTNNDLNEIIANRLLDLDKFDTLIDEEYNTNFNIIYLDFDGVISTMAKRFKIDETPLNLLLNLLETVPNTYIILTTSWRYNNLELTMNNTIKDSVLLTKLKPYIIGQTMRNTEFRGVQISRINNFIKYDLIEHIHNRRTSNNDKDIFNIIPLNIDFNYVILDDDRDMIMLQEYHFVHTNSIMGLCEFDIEQCKNILGYNDKEVEPILTDESIKIVISHSHISKPLESFSMSTFDNLDIVYLPILDSNGELFSHNIITKIIDKMYRLINATDKCYIIDIDVNLEVYNIISTSEKRDEYFLEKFNSYLMINKPKNITIKYE